MANKAFKDHDATQRHKAQLCVSHRAFTAAGHTAEKKGSLTPSQCTAHSAAFIIVHNRRPFLSPHAHITKSQQQVCMQIRGKNKQFREVKGTMKVHSSSSFLSKRYKIEFGEPLSADPMCTSPPTEAYMIRKQKKKKNSTSLECTALPPL
jgi:hypothetical protein